MLESSVSNTIYRIDRNMPNGHYFLGKPIGRRISCSVCTVRCILTLSPLFTSLLQMTAENRFSSSFDVELRHHSKKWKDRMGAALWKIDETGALGTDSKNKPIVHYQSRAYPGDGTWPAVHYKVALVQADNRFDLEKSFGRGRIA